MNSFVSARLVGYVHNVPDVFSFVRPVFTAPDGKVSLQRICDGTVVGWDVYEPDDSIFLIESTITISVGDAALVGFEFALRDLVVGDLFSVSRLLYEEDTRGHPCFANEGVAGSIRAFCAEVESRCPVPAESTLLRLSGKSRQWGTNDSADLVYVRVADLSPALTKLPLINSNQPSFDAFKIECRSSLVREATFLLGQRIMAETLVLDVFHKWESQDKAKSGRLVDMYGGLKEIFRPVVFESLRKRLKDASNNTFSKRGPLLSVYAAPRFDVHWSSSIPRSLMVDPKMWAFSSFQRKCPDAASVFFWIYRDNLSLRQVAQTIGRAEDATLDFLRDARREFHACVFSSLYVTVDFDLSDVGDDPPLSTGSNTLQKQAQLPSWFRALSRKTPELFVGEFSDNDVLQSILDRATRVAGEVESASSLENTLGANLTNLLPFHIQKNLLN